MESSSSKSGKEGTKCINDENEKEQDIHEKGKNPNQELLEDSMLSDVMTAEEYLMNKNVIMLDYERQMFLDIIHFDGLVICAKGIPYDQVLVNFLKVYSDSGNLILVINGSEAEEVFYKSQLDKKYLHEVANTATERERIYLEGGIQFISTRILVVDLLKNRIPVELITGIVVLRAHTIVESCQEAFAIRLYRQKNKIGFIKAFSGSSEAFTIGYSHVERTMRNLFVKELFIWPRFHATIQSSLKPYEPNTIEFHVPMTPKMVKIQTHVLDIMNYLVKEIKRINRFVDLEEVTVENCITKKFHKILQAQLDCIWHQLNSQTKLIVSDLKVLRYIMLSTIYGDSVSAYALIKQYRTTEYALNNSGWVLLDAADEMFKISKQRVYNENDEFQPEGCPKWKSLSEILRIEIPNDIRKNQRSCPSDSPSVKVLILCQDSKTCYQLNQYLTQSGERYLFYMAIKHELPINKVSKFYQNVRKTSDQNKLSVDSSTAAKLKDSKDSLKSKLINVKKSSDTNPVASSSKDVDEESEILFQKSQEESIKENDELTQMLRKDDNEDSDDVFRESYVLTMSQRNDSYDVSTKSDIDDTGYEQSENNENSFFEPFPEMENMDVTSIVDAKNQPIICIQTFKTEKEGTLSLNNILNSFKPKYVVMYHSNVTAIRQLEVYEARQKRKIDKRMKVFFLIHAKTVEEQSYLTSLRREKAAFELLIDTKSKMVVPECQDGKTDEAFTLLKDKGGVTEEEKLNTRKAGGQESTNVVIPKIIVDMREFRSDLPCLIHRRGIEIIPVTITIGDYILTPEICVERKSISDLIGSLNSGRLYNQCMQMQRYYSKPILLIEFDQNKPFHLQSKYMLSNDSGSSNSDIIQKLQLLTLHFPKLRLIWSPSPYATAQLFEELKQGKDEPNSGTAAAIGSDEIGLKEIDNFNSNIYDFMIRLPGITSKNIGKVMRHGGSLKELLKKSQEELSELLESQANAKLLWDILHIAYKPGNSQETSSSVGKSSSYYKYKRGRGRRGK